jgi:hypothetical protein
MGQLLLALFFAGVIYLGKQVIGHVFGHLLTRWLHRKLRKKIPRESRSDD